MALSLGSAASLVRNILSASGGGSSIGSLGDIVFTVSSLKVLTFKDYKRNTKARTASHDIIGQKPVTEFLGPAGEELSFTMDFLAGLGVSPAAQAKRLRTMCETGEAVYFMLGNECIGANKWIVESIGESADVIDANGNIVNSRVDVTLQEYVESIT